MTSSSFLSGAGVRGSARPGCWLFPGNATKAHYNVRRHLGEHCPDDPVHAIPQRYPSERYPEGSADPVLTTTFSQPFLLVLSSDNSKMFLNLLRPVRSAFRPQFSRSLYAFQENSLLIHLISNGWYTSRGMFPRKQTMSCVSVSISPFAKVPPSDSTVFKRFLCHFAIASQIQLFPEQAALVYQAYAFH